MSAHDCSKTAAAAAARPGSMLAAAEQLEREHAAGLAAWDRVVIAMIEACADS